MGYLKYTIPKDFNNLKAKDINNIAKMIANTNTAYWNAIGMAGELNDVLDKINDDEVLKKIVKAFIRLKTKHDTELIDPEIHGRDTQDVSQYFSKLNELIDELK